MSEGERIQQAQLKPREVKRVRRLSDGTPLLVSEFLPPSREEWLEASLLGPIEIDEPGRKVER